ncbi:MAG: tRNA dihydrouridine synthase DusB [Candidatus Zixiibacteriota bacterium]|nr:MAG: tRNA dihydrouridine synthase DusB [candidate division Zixibacteria bacterium]
MTITGNLFLAPLAGISNRPFRLLARKYGAALCYTEMVSADAIAMKQEKTIRMIDTSPDEHPIGVQLFGSRPEYIAGAVRKVLEFGPDLIDLNLGCPVKKVVRKNGGAALLKNTALAEELMAAAVENATVPVTIKIRTGWEAKSDIYIEVGLIAERAGISAITLHARSRTQGYGVKSDWSKIAHLKREISIPVIGNGDVRTPLDAEEMFKQTGCDAIMIGRAAMKNPFVFRQIRSYLEEGDLVPEMTIDEKIELALEHARMVCDRFGPKGGALMMRKHLSWYSKGFLAGAELRRRLKTVCSYEDISTLLRAYREGSLDVANQ